MGDVMVPRLNPTDDTYTLVEWVVPAAAHVAAGDVVATSSFDKLQDNVAVVSGNKGVDNGGANSGAQGAGKSGTKGSKSGSSGKSGSSAP